MEEGGCSRAFECAAQLLQQLAEQEGAPTAPALEECVARWTRLPYKGELSDGAATAVTREAMPRSGTCFVFFFLFCSGSFVCNSQRFARSGGS